MKLTRLTSLRAEADRINGRELKALKAEIKLFEGEEEIKLSKRGVMKEQERLRKRKKEVRGNIKAEIKLHRMRVKAGKAKTEDFSLADLWGKNKKAIPSKIKVPEGYVPFVQRAEGKHMATKVSNAIEERARKSLKSELEAVKRGITVDDDIKLAIGAQVLLSINLDTDNGFVNGSMGTVVGFNEKGWPVCEFEAGTRVISPFPWTARTKFGTATWKQLPLQLGWAITIHKSQGMTIKWLSINPWFIFAEGQAYVAFSRGCTLEGISVAKPPRGREARFRRIVRVSASAKEFYAWARTVIVGKSS
jgi:hypothetical protein